MIKTLLELFAPIKHFKNLSGEDALSNAIAVELKALSIEGRLNCIWFHVPNEMVIKNNADIARLKRKHAIGMISGAPDFVFLSKNKSICIELKTQSGKLSKNQKLFEKWAINKNISFYVARTVADVKKYLLLEGVLNE